MTLGDIVKELNDELRAANVRDAVLLGHSIAGVLLPLMVIEDQSLYSRLVYLATAVPAEGQSIIQLLGSSLRGQNSEEVGWPLNPLSKRLNCPERLLKSARTIPRSDTACGG